MTIQASQLANVKMLHKNMLHNTNHVISGAYMGVLAYILGNSFTSGIVHTINGYSVHTTVVDDSRILVHGKAAVISNFDYQLFVDRLNGAFGTGFHAYMQRATNAHTNHYSNTLNDLVGEWIAKHDRVAQLKQEAADIEREISALEQMIKNTESFADIKKNVPSTTLQRWNTLKKSKHMRLAEIETLI